MAAAAESVTPVNDAVRSRPAYGRDSIASVPRAPLAKSPPPATCSRPMPSPMNTITLGGPVGPGAALSAVSPVSGDAESVAESAVSSAAVSGAESPTGPSSAGPVSPGRRVAE